MNDTRNVHIALLLMCKNEMKRIQVTLESIIGHINSMVIFDTGSTDSTIEIIQKFSKDHNIPLRLKQGEFVDFSTSRNVSLEFADTFGDIDYLLLLDVNDELKGGTHLRKFAVEHLNNPYTGFLVAQEWWSGQYDKYFNIRFVKAREGWRYMGRVHEWMKNTKYASDDEAPQVFHLPDTVVLYQDRTQDDDKSGKRFIRDKELLLCDYSKDPTDTRIVFYLAQTCSCLNQFEDAHYYYKIRTTLEGFQEEKFQSFLRCGETSEKLKHDWHDSFIWYMKAFEHSPRAEPLVKIIEYYHCAKNWLLAFTFSNLACKLAYPDHCILFVDKQAYDYKRWHHLGIIGWYSGHYTEGKMGCLKAIECGHNNPIDTDNLKFYENREQEEAGKTAQSMTKRAFIDTITTKLTKEHPNLSKKQITNKANTLWKNRNK